MNTESGTRTPSTSICDVLCCPICRHPIVRDGQQIACQNTECGATFPIVHDVPVMINEASSVFAIEDFVNSRPTTTASFSAIERLALRFTPSISRNTSAKRNYALFSKSVLELDKKPRVLVLGAGEEGDGIEVLRSNSSISLVETDVTLSSNIDLICDSHDIPFQDDVFDGVVIQAVLEHVADPSRCVEEIHRVLKKDGLVYAEIPFMQQVHGGKFDFTRFTFLGLRRLFRKFEQVEAGACGGPGMALAWSYQYFLLSFFESRRLRGLIRLIVRITAFWLKYIDGFIIDTPGTLDAASGFHFIGRKSDAVLTDREVLEFYYR